MLCPGMLADCMNPRVEEILLSYVSTLDEKFILDERVLDLRYAEKHPDAAVIHAFLQKSLRLYNLDPSNIISLAFDAASTNLSASRTWREQMESVCLFRCLCHFLNIVLKRLKTKNSTRVRVLLNQLFRSRGMRVLWFKLTKKKLPRSTSSTR